MATDTSGTSALVTGLQFIARAINAVAAAVSGGTVNPSQNNTFTGIQTFTKPPVISAGALGSTTTFSPEGNVFVGVSAAGTNLPPQTSEFTFATFNLGANSLDTVGRGLEFYAMGSFANNADGKTVRIRFGSAMVFSSGSLATANVTWSITGRIFKTASNTQVGFFDMKVGTTVQQAAVITGTEIDANTLAVSLTGQSTVANAGDLVANAFIVKFTD